MSDSFWNIRSSSEDDDPEEDEYGSSSSPFYYEDDAYGEAYSSGLGYDSSLYSKDEPAAITRDDVDRRRARPMERTRSARPRTQKGSSRFDRGRDKGSSSQSRRSSDGESVTKRLGGGLNALRKRLPGGDKDRSRTRDSTGSRDSTSSRDRYSSRDSSFSSPSRSSPTRSFSLSSQDQSRDRRDSGRSRDRSSSSGDGRRIRINNPFSRFRRDKSGVRETRRPPSPPSRVKKAEPLPRSSRTPRIRNEGISLDRKLDIAGILMIGGAAIIFFGAISGNEGELSGVLLRIIYQIVGVGWIAVPVALGGIGLWLILRHFGDAAPELDYVKLLGWIVTYLGTLVTFHFIHFLTVPLQSCFSDPPIQCLLDQLRLLSDEAAQVGHGGGWIGGQLYMLMIAAVGDVGVFIALAGWWVIGIVMATDLMAADVIRFVTRPMVFLWGRYGIKRARPAAPGALAAATATPSAELAPGTAPAALEEGAAQQQALPEPELATGEAPALPASHTLELDAAHEIDASRITINRPGRQQEDAAAPTTGSDAGPSREPLAEPVAEQEPAAAFPPRSETWRQGITRLRRPATPSDSVPEPVIEREEPLVPEPVDSTPTPETRVADEGQARSPGVIYFAPGVSSPGVRSPGRRPPDASPLDERGRDRALASGGSDGDGTTADPGEAIDETFLRPAQPRDPDRARQRYEARQRGAGLSPAERAALDGIFAEEDEDEESPETVDDVVYEPVEEVAQRPDDDLLAIDLDEDDASAFEGATAGSATAIPLDDLDEAGHIADLLDRSAPFQPASPVHRWQRRRTASADEIRGRTTIEHTSAPTAPTSIITAPTAAIPSGTQTWDVPDFQDILSPTDEHNIDDEVLLDRARIIEDTLNSFGAPGKVVEVNPGPVITQFGVEPDYVEGRGGRRTRVKVQAIARLADDMALALAARSIRIEAPVPGRGFVGIEVPNAETQLVSLRDVMESREFRRVQKNTKLAIGLGQSVNGTPIAADLTAMPHLLIAGTTGSGKSVCVNAIINCLLLQNTPDDMRFIMVDPKRVELTYYNGIPHLVAPVVVELERIVGVLKWVTREMDERYKKFNQAGARNIADYNKRVGRDEKPLPYLVVVVDELADLMMLAPDETERVVTRLAQMARATGIHLIISTQRPSVDIITGLIKANFPARIAFAVASSVDSRVILDQPGAERLLGRGDMLFQAPDAAAPVRLQGTYVSDEEMNRLIRYWKGVRSVDDAPTRTPSSSLASTGTVSPIIRRQPEQPAPQGRTKPNPWDAIVPLKSQDGRDSEDEGDELYDEAVEVVRALKKASISLLQRQLRIGYTRAARLIDVMEERGVVGPAQSGSLPRKVISYSDDDDLEDLALEDLEEDEDEED